MMWAAPRAPGRDLAVYKQERPRYDMAYESPSEYCGQNTGGLTKSPCLPTPSASVCVVRRTERGP